jgi:chromosome segregation ATPase
MTGDGNDEERLVADIDSQLKALAKADPRDIKEIVESALDREFSTSETAAIERRIDEKRQRITTIESEINERKRELAEERDELSRLEQQLDNYRSEKEQRLEEARSTLSDTPKEPDNPAIKRWANDLGMTPGELIDKL